MNPLRREYIYRDCVLTATLRELDGMWSVHAKLRFPPESGEPTLIGDEPPAFHTADEAWEAMQAWAREQVDERL